MSYDLLLQDRNQNYVNFEEYLYRAKTVSSFGWIWSISFLFWIAEFSRCDGTSGFWTLILCSQSQNITSELSRLCPQQNINLHFLAFKTAVDIKAMNKGKPLSRSRSESESCHFLRPGKSSGGFPCFTTGSMTNWLIDSACHGDWIEFFCTK